MMTEPCNKGPEIESLQKAQLEQGAVQAEHGGKIDRILENQERSDSDLKQTLDRLTNIIEVDIATRKDVEQLKKDRDTSFSLRRKDVGRIEDIERRNAKCDGMGIFERFPKVWDFYKVHSSSEMDFKKVWNWYQQELGIRRFIPASAAAVSIAITVYVTFIK